MGCNINSSKMKARCEDMPIALCFNWLFITFLQFSPLTVTCIKQAINIQAMG